MTYDAYDVRVDRSDGRTWGPVRITEVNADAAVRAAIASMPAPARELREVDYAIHVRRHVERCAECGRPYP